MTKDYTLMTTKELKAERKLLSAIKDVKTLYSYEVFVLNTCLVTKGLGLLIIK